MADVRWTGGAAAVAQVSTYAFGGTWETDDIIRVVIGSKKYDFTAGSATTATVVSNMVSTWNALSASDYPEFAEITASANSTTLTLTADTAGVPFTATLTPLEANAGAADSQTIEGAGTATTGTTATAATGPNHWDDARNWSGGAVPVNSDNVYIENSAVHIRYGLAQSGVTLTSLNIAASFTGDIGLAEVNSFGSTSYLEYRSQYLAIGATTINIGDGAGQGSGRLKINNGSVQTTLNVRGTATGAEQDLEALLWKGTHASNAVNVTRGTVGVAVYGGETATIATLRVGYQTSQLTDSQVRIGAGTSLTTLNQSGGQVVLNAGLTTVSKTGGELAITSGNVTTLTDDNGTTTYSGAGTITTLNVGHKAFVDFGQDMRGRTVTDANFYSGSRMEDPFSTVTWTNPPRVVRATLEDVSLNFGVNRTYAIST